jgi:hypothetical protein
MFMAALLGSPDSLVLWRKGRKLTLHKIDAITRIAEICKLGLKVP